MNEELSKAFSNGQNVINAAHKARRHLRPPPDLKPSVWAERSVHIPIGNAIPGLIRFDNAPYQREPLDMTSNPDCQRITLQWGAQIGKTLLALCAQAYRIEQNPVSQIMMQPSQGDLATWLETKFNPLVESNDQLQELIAKPRGREGVNNQRMKSYPGGFIMFSWSGSPKTMRGRSAPFIVCDETDGYDRTNEGHPVGLLWQRAATFGDQRLLLEISTPSIKGASWIESAYEQGDKRKFYIPCPDCVEHQSLKWSNVNWQQDDQGNHLPETAKYVCEHCGVLFGDGERVSAIRKGEWRSEKPFRGHASYHLSELYSCFRKLKDIVQSFLDKKAANDLQTFVNVSLAETYEVEESEKIEPHILMERVESYKAEVPAGGVVLTAGVDMQKDRIEVETVAWGLGSESWSIDYKVLWGDPLIGDVWNELDDYLTQTFQHESGALLPISGACLDTGGTDGYTQSAYDYAKNKIGRKLFAIKGLGGWGKPIASAPSRKKTGRGQRPVDLFMVGVDEAKLIVAKRLGIKEAGPGYCHFPSDRDPEYFSQLTAEKLVSKYIKGFTVREWHKTRPRNEALDCRVYALAALKIINPNIPKLLAKLENLKEPESKQEEDEEQTPEDSPTIKRENKRVRKKPSKRSGWVHKW